MEITKSLAGMFSDKKEEKRQISFEVDLVVGKFNLVEEAKRQAQLGLPSFHEKKISSKEKEVVDYLDRNRKEIHNNTEKQFAAKDRQLENIRNQYKQIKAESLNAEFERKARKVMDEQGAFLKKLGYNAAIKIKELEQFKADNQLQREANFPSQTGTVLRYSILFFLITVEGILNSSFFSEGLSSGLIGGFIYAAILASINVMGCFFLGKFAIPWMNSCKSTPKLLGLMALIFSLAYMAMMALSIGHIREQLLIGIENPTRAAWQVMQTDLFSIHDLMSWFLMMLTLGFGLAALIDGYTLDDTYPGYGDIVRRTQWAQEEFESEFEEVREELEEIKQDNLEFIDSEFKSMRDLLDEAQKSIEAKEDLIRYWQESMKSSEIVLYAAIRKFRIENEIAREDGFKPAYFDTMPTLEYLNEPTTNIGKEKTLIDQINQNLSKIEKSISQQREAVYASFEEYVSKLNHLKYH